MRATVPGPPVAPAVRVASEWTWRLLVIALGVYALVKLVANFSNLLVPVLVSLLLAALLQPLVELLCRAGVPRAGSALLSMLLLLLLLTGLFALVGQQAVAGFSDLRDQAVAGIEDVQRRLAESPLNLSSTAVSDLVDKAEDAAQDNQGALLDSALGVASTATRIAEGLFIIFFSTFFFLSSGRGIWAWLLGLMPRAAREPLDEAGRSGWVTLSHYVRATLIVAVVDGLGVGIGAALLGVPLALPLGVVVFLGAFIPVVGALLSGVLAVLVALVAHGPFVALGMLAVVLGVQQVEAHALQPFLLGRAVSVHPLAVILAIAAGAGVAGIPGALFAVPLAAVANTMISSIARYGSPGPDPGEEVAEQEAPLSPDRPEATDVEEDTPDLTTSTPGAAAGR
ncbi:MAG TPA: AI-2E family transporter [Mycobacteriales bacterium]|jgi:predicted PurR-regulated permease PerM|nr:AI-2E family transporter [Mycobacteriales bacterium]